MSALEALRWQNFVDPSNELMSTEGKQGVPRYGGEPSVLREYAYRVRLREAREQSMDSSELKKLGPLGLRLVDDLSGTALFKLSEAFLSKNLPSQMDLPPSSSTSRRL